MIAALLSIDIFMKWDCMKEPIQTARNWICSAMACSVITTPS